MARSTRSSSTKKKPVEEEESVVEEEETSVEEDDDDEEQEEEQALTQQLAPVQEENDSDAADQESEGASIIAEEGASVVPKGLALKTLTDIIEYYCEMVFIDRRKRQEYIAVIEVCFSVCTVRYGIYQTTSLSHTAVLFLSTLCSLLVLLQASSQPQRWLRASLLQESPGLAACRLGWYSPLRISRK